MRTWLFVAALLVAAGPESSLAGTRTVDGNATGRYHNDVLKRWTNVPIVVYVDDASNAYIMSSDGGIVKARGLLSPTDTREALALLRKSQNWVKTAKAEGLEVTKELGTFMRGSRYERNGVGLQFFSANGGKQTDVILQLVDFENQFFKLDLYLNPDQVADLIRLMERVPETVAELKKHNAAAAKLR